MNDEIHLLLNQLTDERVTHRKREAFLISVIIHLVVIILIIVSPRLFPANDPKSLSEIDSTSLKNSKQLGFLALPHDYQKLLRRPKAPVLSDKDRLAQGKAPKIDPKGIRAPYSEGKTKLPEQSAPAGVPQPPSPPPLDSASSAPSQDSGKPPSELNEESKQLALLQNPPAQNQESGDTKTNLRDLFARLEVPGASIQSSLEKARKSGSYGSGGNGGGESLQNFDNRRANFSVEQPTILSDTHGVDFGPWLRLIYFRVRDNWYAVIPEVIRSGTKGKVVIIFDILNTGRIENLQVVKSSGLSPYDRAAISSVKLSEPFPNFPPAFTGNQITLQFSYFYNINL